MTASSRQESSTTTRIQPTKISDLRPGWIGDAYFRALVEVKSSDLEEESSTTTVKKAQQQQQQQKEFLVGDASAKITFRCSDKREGLFFSLSVLFRILFFFFFFVSLHYVPHFLELRSIGDTHTRRERKGVCDIFSTVLTPRVSSSHTFLIIHTTITTHTAETIKPNEIYHLQSGKIEMIRGQMRLMTDRKTYDKSAVAPVAPGQVSLLPPEADVPKAKDCGAMDLSVLFFERIQ